MSGQLPYKASNSSTCLASYKALEAAYLSTQVYLAYEHFRPP